MNDRQARVQRELFAWARERAARTVAMSSEHHRERKSVYAAELLASEREFRELVASLPHSGHIRQEILGRVRDEYVLHRFGAIERNIRQFAHAQVRGFSRLAPNASPFGVLVENHLNQLLTRTVSWSARFPADPFETALFGAVIKGSEAGLDDLLAAEKIAVEARKHLRFSVAPGQPLFELLWGIPAEDVVLVRRAYAERYGEDLARTIHRRRARRQLSPNQCARLVNLLEGNRVEAVRISLRILANRRRRRRVTSLGSSLRFLFEPLTKIERRLLLRDAGHELAMSGFDGVFGSEGALSDEAALLGSRVEMSAAFLRSAVLRGDAALVVELLRATSNIDLSRISRMITTQEGIECDAWLRRHLPSGVDCDLAVAYVRADQVRVVAYEVHRSLTGESSVWLGDLFRGKSAKSREEVERAYNLVFSPVRLRDQIRRTCHWRDAEILIDLLDSGSVPVAKLLWFCVAGIGTDEGGLHELLNAMSPNDRVRAAEDYRKVWSERAPWFERWFPDLFGDLEARIWLECGGDAWHDLRELLREQHEELERRAERLYAHERSGWLTRRLDRLNGEARAMEHDIRAVRDYVSRYGSSFRDPYLEFLLRLSEFDCLTFREGKHALGNRISTGAAAVSGIILTALLPHHPSRIGRFMMCVGAMSITVRLFVKRTIKGSGYHKNEAFADLFFGALDGATLFLSQAFRQAALRSGSRMASKLGIRSSLNSVLRRFRHVSVDAPHIGLDDLIEGRPEETVPAPPLTTLNACIDRETHDLFREMINQDPDTAPSGRASH